MTLFVLGAPDPEMAAIEQLLVAANQWIAYATADGSRVHPGNAYRADGFTPALDTDALVLVECGGPAFLGADPVTVIDHHRPGDPGYGRPPAEFLPASSIGQILSYLAKSGAWAPVGVPNWREPGHIFYGRGWLVGVQPTTSKERLAAVVPRDVVFTAAADHCLAAAYAGQCPGIDPDALMEWRARTRAGFQGRAAGAVLDDVRRAMATLLTAPQICARCGRVCYAERPSDPLACGVCAEPLPVAHLEAPVPECPEAAARLGLAFRVTLDERGRRKEVIQAAPAAAVEAFIAKHHAAGRETYGDPARGFAGAYL